MMPSHPDRVRRNYEPKIVIKFKDIPIHICDKAPLNPMTFIDSRLMDSGRCPFCFKELLYTVKAQ